MLSDRTRANCSGTWRTSCASPSLSRLKHLPRIESAASNRIGSVSRALDGIGTSSIGLRVVGLPRFDLDHVGPEPGDRGSELAQDASVHGDRLGCPLAL